MWRYFKIGGIGRGSIGRGGIGRGGIEGTTVSNEK